MKKRKNQIIALVLIIIIIFLVILLNRKKDYVITYDVDNYEIVERYIKKLNSYLISTTYEDNNYEIILPETYIRKKKIIDTVELYDVDKTTCLYMKSNKVATYPSCTKDGNYISHSLIENIEDYFTIEKSYNIDTTLNNIKINYIGDKNILVWNHYGYELINKNKQQSIELLKNESYGDNNSFMIDNYVLLPNYDELYKYKTFYVIDLKTNKSFTWNIDFEINYDFYFLGTHDSKGYIVDAKDKIEYEINPKNKKIEIVSKNGLGKIWNDGWEEESVTRMSYSKYNFYDTSIANYHIKDGNLYLTYYEAKENILISNLQIDRIISQNGLDVYYVSKDKLYHYNMETGEEIVLTYRELEFNKNISIYIY